MNASAFQAVVRTDRQIQIFDWFFQVAILFFAFAFDHVVIDDFLFGQINDQLIVIDHHLRSHTDGISGIDGAVGPDFNCQLVIVGRIFNSGFFYFVIRFLDGCVDAVNGDVVDIVTMNGVFFGTDIAVALSRLHHHSQFLAGIDVADIVIRIVDRHLFVCQDIGCVDVFGSNDSDI